MLTIIEFVAHGWLQAWEVSTDAQPLRYFYFTAQWERDFNELESTAKAKGLAPTPRRKDWVAGFVDRFVVGKPRAELIRNRGFAMEPPFKRLRSPDQAVVELRTEYTRTFGFFAHKDVFIAHRLIPVELLKVNRRARVGEYARYAGEVQQGLLRRLHRSEVDGSSDVETLF